SISRVIAVSSGSPGLGCQSDGYLGKKILGRALDDSSVFRTAVTTTSGGMSQRQCTLLNRHCQLQPKQSSGRLTIEVNGEYGRNRPKWPPPMTTTFGSPTAQARCAPAESTPT